MRFTCAFFFLFTTAALAQYYGERVTEQSFDKSSLYYKPAFLNRFSFSEFSTTVSAVTRDPFFLLYLNPANLSADTTGLLLSIDFMGDRSDEGVQGAFVMPAYYSTSYRFAPVDYRWFNTSRPEPAPVIAVGALAPKFNVLGSEVRLGGSYQAIYRQEKFYTVPYWIYYPSPYYDVLGLRYANTESIPVTVKSSGKDEMLTNGHLANLYASVQLSSTLAIGAGYSYVSHDRDGGYKKYDDNSMQSGGSTSTYSEETARNNGYSHHDLSAGIYFITNAITTGLKAGWLSASASQKYSQHNYNFYTCGTINQGTIWSYYYSDARTEQIWNQDADVPYAAISFTVPMHGGLVYGSYQYSSASVNSVSASTIEDTSFNSSRWEYNNGTNWSKWSGYSYLYDSRSGKADITNKGHEAMLGAKWQVTPAATLSLGLCYTLQKYTTEADDPATVRLGNNYTSASYTSPQSTEYNRTLEKKNVEWIYNSTNWEFTIPLILTIDFSSRWQWTVGLIRSLKGWVITDETTAYFDYRNSNRNGVVDNKTLFGERYSEPAQRITEENFDVFTGALVKISPKLQAKVLLNPETTRTFDLLWQWWLGIQATL